MREPKNDLSCGVVRDLLPLYVEGLTCEETNAAVQAHLEGCADCAARKNALAAPMEAVSGPEEEKAVDYLKTLRSRSRWRLLAAVALTVLLLAGGALAKIYLIGSPVEAAELDWTMRREEDTLYLEMQSELPGTVLFGWRIQEADGAVTITARRAPSSLFHQSAAQWLCFPAQQTDAIDLCGVRIWEDGVALQPQTLDIWRARTPYVGSMPALGALARQLGTYSLCGDFTNELFTGQEPYGWALNFTAVYEPSYSVSGQTGVSLDDEMHRQALQMLALVENLGYVQWSYAQDSGGQALSSQELLDLEGARLELAGRVSQYNLCYGTDYPQGKDVKDYAESPLALQVLRDILYDRAPL